MQRKFTVSAPEFLKANHYLQVPVPYEERRSVVDVMESLSVTQY